MNICFLVTSAINTKHGVFDLDTRYNQTLNTIKSIREKVPEAKIVILEMSAKGVPEKYLKDLYEKTELYVDFSTDKDVNAFYDNIDNHDVVKNLTEMVCFAKFLHIAKENNIFKDIDRVFKVSGRYVLSDNFNILNYQNIDGKYTFKRKYPTQFNESITGGTVEQYMSRLWSFDISLFDEIYTTFPQMVDFMIERINAGGYIDIEHLLYKFLGEEKVVQLDMTGVSGALGPNGYMISD